MTHYEVIKSKILSLLPPKQDIFIVVVFFGAMTLIALFYIYYESAGFRVTESNSITYRLVLDILKPYENFNCEFDVLGNQSATKRWKAFLNSTENQYLIESRYDMKIQYQHTDYCIFYFFAKNKGRPSKTFIVYSLNDSTQFLIFAYYQHDKYVLLIQSENTREVLIDTDGVNMLYKKVLEPIDDIKSNKNILPDFKKEFNIFAIIDDNYGIHYCK